MLKLFHYDECIFFFLIVFLLCKKILLKTAFYVNAQIRCMKLVTFNLIKLFIILDQVNISNESNSFKNTYL